MVTNELLLIKVFIVKFKFQNGGFKSLHLSQLFQFECSNTNAYDLCFTNFLIHFSSFFLCLNIVDSKNSKQFDSVGKKFFLARRKVFFPLAY